MSIENPQVLDPGTMRDRQKGYNEKIVQWSNELRDVQAKLDNMTDAEQDNDPQYHEDLLARKRELQQLMIQARVDRNALDSTEDK